MRYEIDTQDLMDLNRRFAEEDRTPHSRPFAAAIEIMRGLGLNPFDDVHIRNQVMDLYIDMYPNSSGWPGMGIGLVAALDSVRPVTVAVGYGTANSDIREMIGFDTDEQWALFAGGDDELLERHHYDYADLHDFTYGLSEMDTESDGYDFWLMSRAYLEVVTHQLQMGIKNPGIVQSICLVCETAMKGALQQSGVTSAELRSRTLGHNMPALMARMAAERPSVDDPILQQLVELFPNYVDSRYSPGTLRRLDRVRLAAIAQFVAGSAMRRVSDRSLMKSMTGEKIKTREASLYMSH